MRSRKLTKKMRDAIYGALCAGIDKSKRIETEVALTGIARRYQGGAAAPGDGAAAVALVAESVELTEKETAMRLELRRVLDSCTTTGQLVSVWPEVKALVKSLCPAPRKAAPVAPSAELTAYLGLGGDHG